MPESSDTQPLEPVGGPPPVPSNQTPPAPPAEPGREERFLAAVGHLCIVAMLPAVQGPLVIWLVERINPDRSEFVMGNAKQALGYQVLMAAVIGIMFFTRILIPLAIVLGLAAAVYGIIAAVRAYEGRSFEYFWIGHFIREL
ncbi:MAG TPA: DUF4870 domain-containing protein [Planctomycetota bacterium]|nr:DUF4870 domain-containing protein [Planctomycetota bacterium]